MFLLILESLGTWELLLVGMVALVIFGPRKIPELARKAGKMMAEFRKVSNDFKSTWEQEAALGEDEKNAFNFDEDAIARDTPLAEVEHPALKDVDTGGIEEEETETLEGIEAELQDPAVPEIREITDKEQIEKLKSSAAAPTPADESPDKKNWL